MSGTLTINFSTDEVQTLLMSLATARNSIVQTMADPNITSDNKANMQTVLNNIAALNSKIINADWL